VSDWRHPGERRDLVERLVKAEKRARIAEGQARVLMAEVPKDEITVLLVRITELEDMVERQNRRIIELQSRRKTA